MKVDFYISSLSSGGAEHVLINVASYFNKKGNNVSITSYEKRPQFYHVCDEINVNYIKNKSKFKLIEILKDYRDTLNYLRYREADISISFLSRSNIMLILSSLFYDNKVIVCDRNNLLEKYPRVFFWVTCFIYRFCDLICVQTEQMRMLYPRYLQKKIVVIENPLDLEEMNLQIIGKKIKKENIVVSVGRLEAQKDFITLIKAFSIVNQTHPDWKLNIFGQGGMKEELYTLIKQLKAENYITLCGITTTPFYEMKRSKVFVLSSFYEGFPNVLCEAMYAGLPCVSTNCKCGPSDLIEDGINGILVPVADVETMADNLCRIIENDELQKKLGVNAHNTVKRLDINTICKKWEDLINRVI